MKTIKTTLGILAISLAILTVQSCGSQEEKKEATMMEHDNSDGHHDNSDGHHNSDSHTDDAHANVMKTGKTELINDYLGLKNALTKDDKIKASEIANKMVETIKGFDVSVYDESEQSEIKEILETAIGNSEHIAKSPLPHQREHFKELSTDMIDLIAIIGSSSKLYQLYCPMYDNKKGASWLSSENTIENPYYGSKMLSCGKVEKEYK